MKVTVSNFQSLRLVELEVKGLTVVVGPSNVGKSALIRALSSVYFGRPGDYFITLGEKLTSVKSEGTPTSMGGREINLEWRKGTGENKFIINGETYDKVGTETPVPIQAAGFKDIAVGNEYLRPQVHGQMDRVFILDRAGSFIHDAVAQSSRLSVLLKADRNCSSDLKRNKALLKVRIDDLDKAREKLTSMEPIKELHARVMDLKEKTAQIKKTANRLTDLREMAKARKTFKEVTALSLPDRTDIPQDLGARAIEVAKLAAERKIYLSLPSLPPTKELDLAGLEGIARDLPTIRQLAEERKKLVTAVQASEASLRSATTEEELVQAELDTILAGIKICPVCERPMETQSASVHSH
jgi:exonuclease SbcC